MPYKVSVDWAPACELIMSLDAYAVQPSHRSLDLGDDWVARTRAQLPPDLAALSEAPPLPMLTALVHQCPGPRTAESFLGWLAGLSPGELYERLAAEVAPDTSLPADLGAVRDGLVDLLSRWNEAYFRHLPHFDAPPIATEGDPVAVVEEATRGYYIAPDAPVAEVRLIPQFHKRPLTLEVAGRNTLTFFVPAPDPAGAPGEPGSDLVRVVRALADDSRLRILHCLAGAPRTFTEVVAHSDLTKGTVHRHLWTLRFAGLVRVFHADGRLTLRPGAFGRVAAALEDFVAR